MQFQHAKYLEENELQRAGTIKRSRWTRRGYLVTLLTVIFTSFLIFGLILWLHAASLPISPARFMSADEHAATVRQDFIAARNYSMVGDIARGTELLEQPRPPTTGVSVPERRGEPSELPTSQNASLTEADIRLPAFLQQYGFLMMQAAAIVNSGVGIWFLAGDCKDYSDSPDGVIGFKCVYGALSTALGAGVLIQKAYIMTGWIKGTLNIYLGQVHRERDLVVERAIEESMSAVFGSEVRSIGLWDRGDSTPGHPITRDENESYLPIFGAVINGTDMHFAYMGEQNNASQYRIGYGPGPSSGSSNRRINGRELYNKQVFDQGGIDFIVQTGLDNEGGRIDMIETGQGNFDWLYSQVECYLPYIDGFIDKATGQLFTSLLEDIRGLYFRLDNTLDGTTIAAGAIAPFSATTPSVIGDMRVKTDFGGMDKCEALTSVGLTEGSG